MTATIRYLKRDEIEDSGWNHCISHAINGNIYAYSWYLDIVSPDWSALVMGDYEHVFPLSWRKKYGIFYLYQPFFTQQLGLFSRELLTEAICNSFLEAIPKKFRLIQINLNSYNKTSLPDFQQTAFTNLELDLIEDYPSIAKGYSENLRRNLKKAQSAGLTIKPISTIESLLDIFRTNKGREIDTFQDSDYQALIKLVSEGERYKAFSSAGVYLPDGSLCAGAVFAFSNKKAIFLFSAGNNHAKATAAIPFLIDDFVHHHCQSQLTLDFEGSNDPDLARFYRGFGAIDCPYMHLEKNKLPRIINIALSIMKQ
ncbi:MAG: hypothetical protein WCO63_15510 [Bacteroidota bacterium]